MMIGQTINDRYHIEALIDRGGMGAVYQATDLTEKRSVALKFLHFFLGSETQRAQTRFHREFRVLARLDHPRIVQAFEYGTYDDVPFLVLELLAGRTLTEEMVAGSMSRSRLLLIARQICEALIYLHEQSIVHRDLKPGNLMLLPPDDAPQVKLMDFGLVRQADLTQQLTQEGMALGTVAYMAPEQAQALPIDFRADLYALGVILYEMATGRPPFVHENPAMMLMQQLTGDPPPPRQFKPDLDEALEQLILDLLAKEPAERPASTELVASRLAQLADGSVAPTIKTPSKRADLIPRVPMIGRESVLDEFIQHWEQVEAGQGQVVLLSGAAGIGKTRLLNKVSVQAHVGGDRVLTGYCREHASLPYQPLIDVLDALLRNLPISVRDELPIELARLLPGAKADTPPPSGPGGNQAEARLRLFAACWDLLQQAAQSQPLMIVIEATHWADPTTLELLDYLARRVAHAPILFVLTYQPEWVEADTPLATFRLELTHSQIAYALALEPLTHDQVGEFLRIALRQANIPTWLVDSFHRATEGNPLFIEETLKTLAAEGQVAEWVRHKSSQGLVLSGQALRLPENVLTLAQRRLQLLSEEDRPILTAAAVLGPEFTFDLLEGVTKLDEDSLLDAIERLLAAHLIEELPLQAGEDLYRFAQESLRQALLNTVSQRRRRMLHRRTGQTIEALYDPSQSRHWPALAYHWRQAEDAPKAIDYLHRAGKQAGRNYANQEAIVFFNEAIGLLKTLPETPERAQQELTLQLALGPVLRVVKGYAAPELEQAYARARELCRQVGETPQLFPALFGLWSFFMIRAEHQTALDLAEQCMQVAQGQSDSALLISAHRVQGTSLFWRGDLAQARAQAEQGIALYDPEQHLSLAFLYPPDPRVVNLGFVAAWSLWLLGYPEQALEQSQAALVLARALSHPFTLAYALILSACSHQFRREVQATQEWAEKGLTLSTQQGFPNWEAMAAIMHGWALAMQGEIEAGLAQMRQGLDSWRAIGSEILRPYFLSLMAEAYGKAEQTEEGLTLLAEAVGLTEKTDERYWEAELYRLQGELLQGKAEDDAEANFQRAIEVAHQQEAKSLELRATVSLSRLWQSQSKQEEARQMLAEIYNWFTEGFDTLDLIQAKALLEELS